MTSPNRTITPATFSRTQALALVAFRVLLTPLFFYSGTGKIMNFAVTASRLPGGADGLGNVLAAGAICVELGCGVALLLGIFSRQAALILIAFTIIATLMFHNFWASPEAQVMAQTLNFLKNLGLIGGLGLIAAFGAGPYALGDRIRHS